MTAAEHEAWLRSTGQYEAMKERSRQEDEARQTQVDEWRRAEAPLVEDLNAGGFAVKSVWDLVNTSEPYPDALPILLDHLQRSYPSRVREGIARAMATPKARFAWDILTRSYREEIGRYGVLAEVYTENSTLRVFVEDNQLGLFPANESTRSSVRIGLPCQGGTIHERTPCTIELAEYTRAENPVDGMAGANGTAIEVGSAVTMLVDCPEGLSIDRGDDWSPLPVSLEPKKFSIYAEDCEVTW